MAIPGRRISTWIAYDEWHCTTLAQRMADIKDDIDHGKRIIMNGIEYEVRDELVTRNGSNFSEYWLEPIKTELF